MAAAILRSRVIGRAILQLPLHSSPRWSRRRWLIGLAADWTVALRRSKKAGPVPRPQFILLIELDDNSRVMYTEYLHTLGFKVVTADITDGGLTSASDADVIVSGIRPSGSRTPKCEEIYRRVIVL